MTVSMKRTAAAMPAAGYHRPALLDADGLSVAVVGESGEDFGTFDFADLEAPVELTRALVAGFARASGPGGRWRSVHTVNQAAKVLRRFAREVLAANPQLTTIAEVTPEVWWGWRSTVESRTSWPGQINLARALLHDVEGLPTTTRRAMNARAPKPMRTYGAYSRDEFRRGRSAAWRVVDAARSRIEANVEFLARYRAGETPADPELLISRKEAWTRGAWLDHLSRTGKAPPSGGIPAETGRQSRAVVGVAAGRSIKEALFLTGGEVFALMALFVCEGGYNGAVLSSMTVSGGRADDRNFDDPVHLVEMDKPRRGDDARFFSNAFAGERATLWEMAVSLTQPARETLATLGHPTDSLFISVASSNRSAHPTGLFRTDWSQRHGATSAWSRSVQVTGDDGSPLRVTLSRLRLSEQVLNERSSQNTQAVSARVYRYPDLQTHKKARSVVLQGQVDALEHAQATVQMRMITGSELAAARTDPNVLAQKLGVEPGKVSLLGGKAGSTQ